MRPAMATAGPRGRVAGGIIARPGSRQSGSARHTAPRGTRNGIHETSGETPVGAAVGAVVALHRRLFAGRNRPHYRNAGRHREIPPALRQAGTKKIVAGNNAVKTPRTILLEQHHSVESQLDRLWTEAIVPNLRPGRAHAPRLEGRFMRRALALAAAVVVDRKSVV